MLRHRCHVGAEGRPVDSKKNRQQMQELSVRKAGRPPGLRFAPERRARVEELRVLVAEGRYRVDPVAVAVSLLRRVPWDQLH